MYTDYIQRGVAHASFVRAHVYFLMLCWSVVVLFFLLALEILVF